MLRDHTIPKPPSLDGYGLHRLVQGLTGGDSPLFVDMGDRVVVRTTKPITDAGTPPRTAAAGEIVGFELRACVARKVRGRHLYYPLADWRSRHAWLRKQGARHGFEPLTIHCRAAQAGIDKGGGRAFTVDRTDFVGVLRVTDAARFARAVAHGVGATAKAFGFGMLVV